MLLRFSDLKDRGIVSNHVTLKRWIASQGFPSGFMLGPNTRVWRESDVDAWLQSRPIKNEKPPRGFAAKRGNGGVMIKPPPNVNCPPPLLSAEATGGTKVSFGGDNQVDSEFGLLSATPSGEWEGAHMKKCGLERQNKFSPYDLAFDAETGLSTTSVAFPLAICPGWQVANSKTQWVLQHWRAPQWRDRAFCRTRGGLEIRIRELIGREHQVAVAHLPDWHPDVDGVPEPKRLPNGKLDLRGRNRISTAARGQMIREQVLAQLHLPNPITITLPNGTTTRVWLATGKDGKKIVGDALWWGVNCAGRAETPLEVVSSHETAATTSTTTCPPRRRLPTRILRGRLSDCLRVSRGGSMSNAQRRLAEQDPKWELIRRFRLGEMRELFRHRWGYTLPDTTPGRLALLEMTMNLSLARAADNRVENAIEIWAPWMGEDERKELVSHLNRLDLYERIPTGREIGERLGVTNEEYERLNLKHIKPVDRTDEQLAERRKARRNERRRNKSGRTREAYLAELASKPKPWIAEGISQRTWQRRRKSVSLGMARINFTKQVPDLSTECAEVSKEAASEVVSVEKPRDVVTKVGEMERKAPCSPGRRTIPRDAHR